MSFTLSAGPGGVGMTRGASSHIISRQVLQGGPGPPGERSGGLWEEKGIRQDGPRFGGFCGPTSERGACDGDGLHRE